MIFPLSKILQSLYEYKFGFKVVYFKELKDKQPFKDYHYYITISLPNEENILISIITSQYQKCYDYYVRKDAESSLVYVTNDDLDCLSKESVINCNETKMLSKNELENIIYDDLKTENCFIFIKGNEDINVELKKKIISAINESPLVKNNIKKKLIEIKRILDNEQNIGM